MSVMLHNKALPLVITLIFMVSFSLLSSSFSNPFLFDTIDVRAQTEDKSIIKDLNSNTTSTAKVAENSFKTYANSTYGVKIQYPSTWIIKQNQSGHHVQFVSTTHNASVLIGYSTIAIPFDEGIAKVTNYLSSADNGKLIESTHTILAGNPAHKFVHTYTIREHLLKEMQVHSQIGSRIYVFMYTAAISDYAGDLPAAQKMLDSFQVIMSKSKE